MEYLHILFIETKVIERYRPRINKLSINKKTGARLNPSWCDCILFAKSETTCDSEGCTDYDFASGGRWKDGGYGSGDDASFPSECLGRSRYH